MLLKRRTFLRRLGLALGALGISETALSLLADNSLAVPLLDRYYRATAQPNGRKLALLVGINQYPRSPALSGCVTDVELQRELLLHRFGFNPSDVLTLTDQEATRDNIETAFLEHLTGQAKAGDVVVFHFSGYGSRAGMMEDAAMPRQLKTQNSLVPVDGGLLTKGLSGVNNLLVETLLLLLQSLDTDQVTTVLDTSYTETSNVLQGNLRIRSYPSLNLDLPAAEELTFQEQLLARLKYSPEQQKSGQIPGILLAAAGPTQPATEATWSGFSAGLFTYALTQHLWQATTATTIQVCICRAASAIEQLVGKEQQPKLSGQKSGEGSLLAYYLPPDPSMGADGVVTAVEENGKTAHLWLAGLPANVLESYGINSLFTLLDPSSLVNSATNLPAIAPGETPESASLRSLQLQIRSREGLTAKAQLIQPTGGKKQEVSSELNAESLSQNSFLIGQLIQESVRVFPRNIGLTVALDSSLERIERVDATSAFANVPYVSSIVASGEQPADYLFGRMSSKLEVVSANQEMTASGYGLFSLGRELIPNTVGEMGEAVKVAINRLMPKLKTRLAAKLWRMTANEGSSRLGVRASLEMVAPTEQVMMQRETWRSHSIFSGEFSNSNLGGSRPVTANNQTSSMPTKQKMASFFEEGIPTLSIGSRIQYKIQNYSDRPIYFVLLGIDSSGSAIALYPLQSSPTTLIEETVIPPEETLTVPQPSTSFEWVVQGSSGLAETQLICSRYPLTQTLIALEAAMSSKRGRVRELLNPLEVARAVLQDLHQASTNTPEISGVASDTYTLDVNAWATLSFVYQVV